MKVGDHVTYNDDYLSGEGVDELSGVIVEPTEQELAQATEMNRYLDIGPANGDVVVEWSDGKRYWEDPVDLVLLREAGS